MKSVYLLIVASLYTDQNDPGTTHAHISSGVFGCRKDAKKAAALWLADHQERFPNATSRVEISKEEVQ